jgi:hypothetical protein
MGIPPPAMPAEPTRMDTPTSLTGPRPVDPGDVFHVKPHPRDEGSTSGE